MKIPVLLFVLCLVPAGGLFAQNRYDVVIDEIMADPTPQVGLPNNEWIELKNVSVTALNLQGWRIGYTNGQSGAMPNFTLQPDSFVIVCTASAVANLSVFGTTISVTGFPSLNNSGDLIFLKTANGKTIHAVNYSDSWYQNTLKANGGWSLEMVDTKNPCTAGSNWKASTDAKGGTPGKKNSVDGINPDNMAPQLKNAYTTDSATIILVFDEPVDSLKGATMGNYALDSGPGITSASVLGPLFDKVQLKINPAMTTGIIYTITATNVADCSNNIIGSKNKSRVGLPSDAATGDWIINEILFNPRPNAYDYVEFYNKSGKIFDASRLYIANRNSIGVISSIQALSASPWYIFPGDYIVATEDASSLALNYLVSNPDNVMVLSSLPSFPDDEGDVIALNFQGNVVDEVHYRDNWHFKLLDNTEGVALERIDPAGSSQDPTNWHSAASTAGYGTPAAKNSEYKLLESINASIKVTPKIFSPDNDGHDDIVTIQYKAEAPGYVANVTIFDVAGRPVRMLVQNGTLGLTGYWNWDGLDDKGLKLPIGTYVVFTEIFNLQGKKNSFKNAVVLARKL